MMDIITGRAPPPARAESYLSKGFDQILVVQLGHRLLDVGHRRAVLLFELPAACEALVGLCEPVVVVDHLMPDLHVVEAGVRQLAPGVDLPHHDAVSPDPCKSVAVFAVLSHLEGWCDLRGRRDKTSRFAAAVSVLSRARLQREKVMVVRLRHGCYGCWGVGFVDADHGVAVGAPEEDLVTKCTREPAQPIRRNFNPTTHALRGFRVVEGVCIGVPAKRRQKRFAHSAAGRKEKKGKERLTWGPPGSAGGGGSPKPRKE